MRCTLTRWPFAVRRWQAIRPSLETGTLNTGSRSKGKLNILFASAIIESGESPNASTCNSGTIPDNLTMALSISVIPWRCMNVGVVVSPLMKPSSSACSISLKSTESR